MNSVMNIKCVTNNGVNIPYVYSRNNVVSIFLPTCILFVRHGRQDHINQRPLYAGDR